VVGIIAGPYVTGGFDPRKWGGAEHEVSNEITLVRRRLAGRLGRLFLECLCLAARSVADASVLDRPRLFCNLALRLSFCSR
jgi:hypothetical protein